MGRYGIHSDRQNKAFCIPQNPGQRIQFYLKQWDYIQRTPKRFCFILHINKTPVE